MIKRFSRADGGNVAIMFGLLLIPLVVAAGIAIDMMRTNDFRTRVQEAADAGVLAAARATLLDPDLTLSDAEAIARRYFDANSTIAGALEIDVFEFTRDEANGTYRLTVNGRMDTALMKLVGEDEVDIDIISSAKVTPPGPIEAVLVLDNTGSMNDDSKIDDLRTASHLLADMLLGSGGGNNKMALVPFAQYVNVGESNRDEDWVDTSALPSGGGDDDDDDDDDDEASSPPPWDGCVGSRNYPLNLQDNNFVTNPVPAIQGVDCPQPILALTNSKSQITTAIEAMDADGWTYIAGGLSWGYRVITNATPFTQGLTTSEMTTQRGVKAIIVLTDGRNTRAPSYPLHESSSESAADSLTTEMCNNVKAAGIRLYTIAFNVSDTGIKTLLTNCASSDGGYFDANNGVALRNTFSEIGVDLTDLALTQ